MKFVSKIKTLLFAFVFIMLTGLSGWAQTAGDYRSVTTGTWTTLSTWQRYSGTAWSTPTTAQGWPGQYTGTGAVTIVLGHVVTIGTGGIDTQPFASINIESTGRLYLNGTNQTVTFSLATSVLNIESGGDVYFFNKSKLVLSADAAVSMTIDLNGLVASTCNNNAELWIGTQKYAVCAGAPGDIFTFAQLIAAGGTLDALPTSNGPICEGITLDLSGSYDGAFGSAPTYSWSVTAPGGGVTTYDTQNVSIASAVTGTYQARLTVTTLLGGTTYTNAETISIVVNALPTLTAASQVMTVCENTPATINLTGLVPNTTFMVNYSINGVAQTAIPELIADESGNSSFTTSTLTTANNEQTLLITGITITSSPTNCTESFTQNVTLRVWQTDQNTNIWTGQVDNDWNVSGNWCGGVPTTSTNVIIPPIDSPNVLFQPNIGTVGGMCKDITINSGATLTIDGSNALSVFGNWTNNGTFTPNTGTVSFVGSGVQQTIGGSGSNTFNNLTINQTGTIGGVKAGSNITVNGILNLASSTPDNPNPSATVGLLEMVTDYSDYPGTTYTNPGYNNMDSWTLFMGATATTTGTGDVTGIIKRNTIDANTAYSFGNQFTTIAFTSEGTLPTNVSVTVKIGASPFETMYTSSPDNKSIKRMYEIVCTDGSGCHVSANFRYLDSELNGEDEAKLVTSDGDIGGGMTTPDEHGNTGHDQVNNFVGMSNIPIDYFIFVSETHAWRTIFTMRAYQETYKVWNGSVSTSWDAEANWTPSGVPGIGDHVIIPDAATTTNDPTPSDETYVNTLTILSGGIINFDNKKMHIVNSLSGGYEDLSGLSSPGTNPIYFDSPGATISGIPRLFSIVIADGADLTVQSGTNLRLTESITRTGTGKFYADIYPNTIEYNGDNQTVITPDGDGNYYNLTLSGSNTKTLPSTLAVSHNFKLDGTAVVSGTSNTLSIGGDFTKNSTATFTLGTVNLDGTSLQTIGGTQSTIFTNLTLNNAAGVILGNSQTVNGNLTLTSGLITTGDNILTHGCDGDITGQSASSYIDGKLARVYCAVGSKDFPIGKGGNYRPLTVNYTALTGTSTVTAEQFETVIPGTFPVNTTYQTNRHWAITETGGSSFTYDLTLDGTPFIPGSGSPKILKGDGTANTALDANFIDPNFFKSTGLTAFGNFAVATECLPPTITAHPSATATCDANGTATFSVTATVSSGTPSYQWEESITGTGGTFVAISNDGVYSNATSATLTLTNPPLSMNNFAYRVVVNRDCGSGVTSNAVVLTVNPLPTITLGDFPAVCEGSTSASLPYTATTGSPDQYRIDYDAAAETAGFEDITYTTLPESPVVLTIPSTPGTYNGTLYVKNSTTTCESVEYPFTVTIFALPQGSLTGNAICSGEEGWLTFTASAGTGPFTVVYNDGTDHTVNNVVSGTPFSVGTVSEIKTYTLVSVTGTHCPRTIGFAGSTATVTILTADQTFTWNGSESDDWHTAANWTPEFVPSSCINVDIPVVTNFPTLYSAGACNNITIRSGASLMDNSHLTVNGTATVEREIANDWKWHFLSSPVASQAIWPEFAPEPADLKWPAAQTAPLWNWDFYYYNPNVPVESYFYWVNLRKDAVANYNNSTVDDPSIAAGYGTTTPPVMEKGRGYLVAYGPDYNGSTTHTFSGSLNTGTVERAIAYNADNIYNLVGNPYPSSIDWTAGTGWGRSNLATSGTGYDYWVWNDAGGNYGVFNSASVSGINEVSKDIAPMQAFFVKVASVGSLTMTNDVRTHSTQPWLKNSPAETDLLRLKLTTEANTFSDEMILSFDPSQGNGGSDKFWSMYTEAPEIFSVKDGNNYSIDRYPEISAEMAIDLSAKCGVQSNYTLTATNISDFRLANQVYLTDIKTGSKINLKETGQYTFSGGPNDDMSRFKLTFAGTIGIETPVAESQVDIYAHNGVIYLSGIAAKADIRVTNLLGQVLQRSLSKGSSLTTINAGNLPKGIYVVTVLSEGQSVSRKVVL
ncbi:MAG: T9SS type A sorting domain-containing protein [Lentimicrobium sp.]|nr:T9SS type A sorting domain-containing protein [Lentimicrobium sp.]